MLGPKAFLLFLDADIGYNQLVKENRHNRDQTHDNVPSCRRSERVRRQQFYLNYWS